MRKPNELKWRVAIESDSARSCPRHGLALTWYVSRKGGAWSNGPGKRATLGDEVPFCPKGHVCERFRTADGEVYPVYGEE